MRLSDAKCRSAQPRTKLHKLTDGGGLQLWVQPTGTRLWRFAYRLGGKQKLLALGVYPSHDPAAEKKRQTQARADAPTLRSIAEQYLAKLKREDRAEATLTKTEWLLEFANAEFGDVSIREVTAPAILKVLQALEARERYESARRLRSTGEASSDTR